MAYKRFSLHKILASGGTGFEINIFKLFVLAK